MNTQELLNAALEYARLGYPVFPCHPGGKTPLTQHGFKDATTDPEQISRWWCLHPAANIGLATAGLVAIDCDGEDNPWPGNDGRTNSLVEVHPALAETPRGGHHWVFRQPEGRAWSNTAGRLAEKVDTRANGGYIVVAPSVVGDKSYQWLEGYALNQPLEELPEPPGWLVEALDALAEGKSKTAQTATSPESADVTGGGNWSSTGGDPDNWREPIERDYESRTTWAEILQPHGWVLVGTGPDGLDRWRRPGKEDGHSATAGVRSSGNDVLHVFSGNALPFHADRTYGKFRAYSILHHAGNLVEAASALRSEGFGLPDPAQSVDLGGFRVGGQGEAQGAGQGEPSPTRRTRRLMTDPGPLPEHLLQVPGFIGDLVRYTLETAKRPLPGLALGAALTLLGTLAGRKVRLEDNTRSNIYVLGVAPSGSGKDWPRQVNKDILLAAGGEKLLGPEGLHSGSALVSSVSDQPACLIQWDEIGRCLKTMSSPQSPHLYSISTNLMKLFSSSGTVFLGDGYADSRRNKSINQPCVCLFGTTVPRSFFEGLTADNVSDGFLSRVLIFEGEMSPKVARKADPLPQELIDVTRWWINHRTPGNLANANPDPESVPIQPEAAQIFGYLDTEADRLACILGDPVGTIWTRAGEKANKLALLYACSCCHESPIIDEGAALWACELSDYLTRRMVFLVSRWVAENQYESTVMRIVRIITEAGPEGITKAELTRKTRALRPKERDEVLEMLLQCGDIRCSRESTGGSPRSRYISNEDS